MSKNVIPLPKENEYLQVETKNRNRYRVFHQELAKASDEEDVKISYIKFFQLSHDTSKKRDLYTKEILYEFKYDKDLKRVQEAATVLAQILYYVHRLKYSSDDKPIPPYLCLADRNETILTKTSLWMKFVDSNKYDWTFAPSSPDMHLVGDLENTNIGNEHVFDLFNLDELTALDVKMTDIYSHNLFGAETLKKDINEQNFEEIFNRWDDKFGESVRNGLKPSVYFVCDIQKGRSIEASDQGRVIFMIDENNAKTKKLNLKDYEHFWDLYSKVTNPSTIQGISSKADRLSDDFKRRFEGEFYTPVPFAKKAIDYLNDVIGGELHMIDWKSGKYRLWDMACGTGNLEYHLPSEAYPYCYLSTLRLEDKAYCTKLFRGATVFQYDYLKDDVYNVFKPQQYYAWKMPQQLVDDLANPELKWIIFINPPFATAQNKANSKESKKDVSMTPVRDFMTEEEMGETSRELAAQFLYRIHYEFKGKTAWLGLFNKIKYINANNDAKLRQKVMTYHFEKGFIFDVGNFADTSGGYPIGFLIWNLHEHELIENQKITVDLLDNHAENFGTKHLFSLDKKLFLNNWIERPKTSQVFPPFSSALNIAYNNKDTRDRISANFICSLCTKGNDIQNQKYVALFSGPYASAGALSVTKSNFLKAMIIHAVRKSYKSAWYDDRDQFYQPYKPIIGNEASVLDFGEDMQFPLGYAFDCVVWSLFSFDGNSTAALSNINYEGKVYQIKNNMFPFTIKQVNVWGISDMDIAPTMFADEDRFAALWLEEHKKDISDEAATVIAAAAKVYKLYFNQLNFINTSKYKITTWDAGLYQIRMSLKDSEIGADELKELSNANNRLADKIRGGVRELGFMR